MRRARFGASALCLFGALLLSAASPAPQADSAQAQVVEPPAPVPAEPAPADPPVDPPVDPPDDPPVEPEPGPADPLPEEPGSVVPGDPPAEEPTLPEEPGTSDPEGRPSEPPVEEPGTDPDGSEPLPEEPGPGTTPGGLPQEPGANPSLPAAAGGPATTPGQTAPGATGPGTTAPGTTPPIAGFDPGPGAAPGGPLDLPGDAVGAAGGAAGGLASAGPVAAPAPGSGFGPAPGSPPVASEDGPASGGIASGPGERGADGQGSPVTRTVREFVEVVPNSVKTALAALAALALMFGLGYGLTALRARRLGRQRRELLDEVGLLQAALLPPVPERFGSLRVSVAYRPAEGPGAGGDFYDVIPLEDGGTAFLLGDVSGHGRNALSHTAFLRYTLRAYLEAGLDPRAALRLAGQVIDDLDGDFATVLLAIHDPNNGALTYSAAGHPAPVVVGPSRFDPVLAVSSPPIGVGLETGRRQTTVPLEPGSVVCLHTDGLTEARTEANRVMGRGRVTDLLDELGRDATAQQLLDAVAADAARVEDDMAACLLAPTAGVIAGGFRTEQIELSAEDLDAGLGERFLAACGVPDAYVVSTVEQARGETSRVGAAIIQVRFGTRGPQADVLPSNVESFEAAARRARNAG